MGGRINAQAFSLVNAFSFMDHIKKLYITFNEYLTNLCLVSHWQNYFNKRKM